MRILIPVLALVLPAFASAATAENAGLAERVAGAVFSATEKTVIEEFFGRPILDETPTDQDSDGMDGKDGKDGKQGKAGKSKKLPPGLAKRDSLPPGLAMQLEKNGTLPPGLAKRDLPPELAQRLPAREDGTETVIVDSDVVLIEAATGVVLDILRGVAGDDGR